MGVLSYPSKHRHEDALYIISASPITAMTVSTMFTGESEKELTICAYINSGSLSVKAFAHTATKTIRPIQLVAVYQVNLN